MNLNSPQAAEEKAFEKGAMTLLMCVSLLVYCLIITYGIVTHNNFVLQIFSTTLVLSIVFVLLVRKFVH